jgi:hypothetical protein
MPRRPPPRIVITLTISSISTGIISSIIIIIIIIIIGVNLSLIITLSLSLIIISPRYSPPHACLPVGRRRACAAARDRLRGCTHLICCSVTFPPSQIQHLVGACGAAQARRRGGGQPRRAAWPPRGSGWWAGRQRGFWAAAPPPY